MRANLIPAAALLAAACATTQGPATAVAPAPAVQAAPAAAVAPAAPAAKPVDPGVANASRNPARYASGFPRAEFCEEEARRLRKLSPDTGWAVLKACVAQGRFTLLSRLIGGGWDKDLQTRPEASVMLARVVANRGGDLEGDLAAIRKQRIPLFPLGPSVLHPDVYKGRLVLFRAQVKEVKLGQGKAATTRLAEYGLGGTSKYVDSDERLVSRSAGAAAYQDSSGYSGVIAGASESQLLTQRRLTGNELAETGLEAVAKMSEVDPFFEPGRQFVVLARLDGVRSEPGEDPEESRKVALVSIVAYFEPSHSVIE